MKNSKKIYIFDRIHLHIGRYDEEKKNPIFEDRKKYIFFIDIFHVITNLLL